MSNAHHHWGGDNVVLKLSVVLLFRASNCEFEFRPIYITLQGSWEPTVNKLRWKDGDIKVHTADKCRHVGH